MGDVDVGHTGQRLALHPDTAPHNDVAVHGDLVAVWLPVLLVKYAVVSRLYAIQPLGLQPGDLEADDGLQ